MKLGIKVAPGNAYKADIEATQPSMVEVWYNATEPANYTDMFAYLKTQALDVGLHFWGVLLGNILPNISHSDRAIHEPSFVLMMQTIDVAAKNGFAYVNIHPDLAILLQVDFSSMNIYTKSAPTDLKGAQMRFKKEAIRLHKYAVSQGVMLTIETVPQRDTPTWNPVRNRSDVIDIHQMPISVQVDLAAQGVFIANDFCHTACNILSNDRTVISDFLFVTTKSLASQTRLIHLGYVIPPYNGVDFHDSLDNPLINTMDAIPNKNEMIELLKLFTNRDDVYILVEPKEDHVKNFFLAKKLLKEAI